MASAVAFLIVRGVTTEAAFMAWGWRLSFLASGVLIAVGLFTRLCVAESPASAGVARDGRRVRLLLLAVLRHQPGTLVVAVGAFFENNSAGYMLRAYLVSHTTRTVGLSPAQALSAQLIGSFVWLVGTPAAGLGPIGAGRRTVTLVGTGVMLVWSFPLFWQIDTGSWVLIVVAHCVLAIVMANAGRPRAAQFSELFPPEWRYSEASLAYALGALLGGAFAPLIATSLQQRFRTSAAISTYLASILALSLLGIVRVPAHLGRASAEDISDRRDPAVADVRP